jgi:hypothetical protein
MHLPAITGPRAAAAAHEGGAPAASAVAAAAAPRPAAAPRAAAAAAAAGRPLPPSRIAPPPPPYPPRHRARRLAPPPAALSPSSQDDDARAQPLARGAVVSVDQFSALEWRRAVVIGNEARPASPCAKEKKTHCMQRGTAGRRRRRRPLLTVPPPASAPNNNNDNNKQAANLDGTYRLLRLSVPDDVPRLSGRRRAGAADGLPSAERWVDQHTSPGQLVGLRLPSEVGGGSPAPGSAPPLDSPPGPRLYPLACTPYETRRDSASLGASLIEVAVSRLGAGGSRGGGASNGSSGGGAPPPPPSSPSARGAAARAEHEAALAELGPGDEVEVSGVVGRGFASLFSSSATLLAALEERRPLLLVASGLKGAALMRAALSWTPVQAHATAAGVCAYYVDSSPARAAFVAEWDAWREAGVRFSPLFLDPPGGGGADDVAREVASQPSEFGRAGRGDGGGEAAAIADLIEQALFVRPGGLEGALGGAPQEAAALLAGLPGKVASAVSRELSYKGVPRERLLFVDFL